MTTGDVGYAELKEKTMRELGRTPRFTAQDWVWDDRYASAPSSSDDGVDTEGAARARVGVVLRKTPGRQRAVVRVDTAQGADTLGIKIGSTTPDTVTGQTSSTAAVTALKAAIDADADFNAGSLNGTSEVPDTQTDALLIEVDGLQAITVGTGVQGQPRVACVAEAQWCLWRPWGRVRGTSFWMPIGEARYTTDDVGVYELGEAAAGYDRLAVEIISCDGACYGWVAAGDRDDDAAAVLEAVTKALAAHELKLYQFPLASASNPVQGTREAAIPLAAATAKKLASDRAGKTVVYQGMIAVDDGGTTLRPANPRRAGFACYNTSSADPYYRAWQTASKAAATTSDLPVDPGNLDAGGDIINGILAIADTGKTVNVWVEEYE